MRLPGVEPGSIAWKAIILTVGLQTLSPESENYNFINFVISVVGVCMQKELTMSIEKSTFSAS